MAYLWLTTKSRKQIMKDNGFYQGAVDSFKDEKYLDAVEKVNKKYLPVRYQKRVYYKETDIILRNLRRLKEAGVKNFKLEEFKCGCGRKYCSGYPVVLDKQLLINLESIRKTFGPVQITCGMRCAKYNSSLKGSIPNSKHLKGKAIDLYVGVCETVTGRDRVKKEWKRLPKYGYTYSDTPNMGKAVHCDVK